MDFTRVGQRSSIAISGTLKGGGVAAHSQFRTLSAPFERQAPPAYQMFQDDPAAVVSQAGIDYIRGEVREPGDPAGAAGVHPLDRRDLGHRAVAPIVEQVLPVLRQSKGSVRSGASAAPD
jgi:hypothetical protein